MMYSKFECILVDWYYRQMDASAFVNNLQRRIEQPLRHLQNSERANTFLRLYFTLGMGTSRALRLVASGRSFSL